MLPADACVTPRGGLVVAAHSGLPDWGSGPQGKGKLYKIEPSDRAAPQPVLAWASDPQGVRVAFDRPIDPASLKSLAKRASIEFGQAVSPGDRFETLRPGYEAVARQMATPRFDLPILSAQVSADRRTLLLATVPHPEAASYALTLPGWGKPRPGSLRQVPEIDLGYDLSGVEAIWTPESGPGGLSAWLPHPDLAVARAFTRGSAEHDRFWEALARPGTLTLRTRIDLDQMLRPAVQPGSTTGYRLPDEEVTVTVSSPRPFTVKSPGVSPGLESGGGDDRLVRITVTPKERRPIPLEITLATGGPTTLDVAWTTREDARPRALPLRRVLLPWATLERPSQPVRARDSRAERRRLVSRTRALPRRYRQMLDLPQGPRARRRHRPRPLEPDPSRLCLGLSRYPHAKRRDQSRLRRALRRAGRRSRPARHAPLRRRPPDRGRCQRQADGREPIGGREHVAFDDLDHARGARHGPRAGASP